VTFSFGQRPTRTFVVACDAAGLGRMKLNRLIGGGQLDTASSGEGVWRAFPSLQELQ